MLFGSKKAEFTEINDYGLIGNMKTAAIVSIHGSIDFMCFPNFDSPTVFGAMLDQEKGGCFSVQPQIKNVRYRQLYLTDTAILVTRFFSDQGMGELSDFMVVDEKSGKLTLVRKASAIRGNISVRVECQPRFGYGKTAHKAKEDAGQIVFTSKQKEVLYLNSTHPLEIKNNDAFGSFIISEGEAAWFFLTDYDARSVFAGDVQRYGTECYRQTFDYWKNWIDKSTFKGRWIETVLRSAITLKLLSSFQYGSVVAAPTFGLPENIGGNRNWDYRYAWIRDSAFTMYAFMKLGFKEEAKAFLQWVETYCLDGEMKLVYTFDGKPAPKEKELKHLSGYLNSKPVLTGNNAYQQTQLDIYGELIDTIYIYTKFDGGISPAFWQKLCTHIDYVSHHWHEPDHGIWEVRGKKKEFLHSRLMCWVALDRGIRIGEANGFSFDKENWITQREQIRHNIHEHFWSREKKLSPNVAIPMNWMRP